MRRFRCFVLAASLGASGCGESFEREQTVAIDKLPAPALAAAHKELVGYTLQAAYKIKFDGQDALEIRGKNKDGKIREVEVTPEGKVLAIE